MPSGAPTVAVVIPTHRRPEFLRDALRSVVAQTFPAEQVVVVSDCHDPAAQRVCDEFRSAGLTSLQFIEAPDVGRGPSPTRNLGAKRSVAEIVAFLDDDDWWHPDYLSTAVATMLDSQSDVVATWISVVTDAGELDGPALPPGLVAAAVVAMNRGTTGSNLLLRRSAFEAVGGFDPNLQNKEDTDLFFRLLDAGARYEVVRQRLIYQRWHGQARLTDSTERHAADQERYLRKHATAMRLRDRREIRRVIHYIRAHRAERYRDRVWHRCAQLWNSDFGDLRESITRWRRGQKSH